MNAPVTTLRERTRCKSADSELQPISLACPDAFWFSPGSKPKDASKEHVGKACTRVNSHQKRLNSAHQSASRGIQNESMATRGLAPSILVPVRDGEDGIAGEQGNATKRNENDSAACGHNGASLALRFVTNQHS
jgi:hypothetical protein